VGCGVRCLRRKLPKRPRVKRVGHAKRSRISGAASHPRHAGSVSTSLAVGADNPGSPPRSNNRRCAQPLQNSVTGVVIIELDAQSQAANKRLNAGDVIVEFSEERVAGTGAVQRRLDQLKDEGRRSALLLVANAEGQLRFVAMNLQ
jgi:S1-C subfamily serine protease